MVSISLNGPWIYMADAEVSMLVVSEQGAISLLTIYLHDSRGDCDPSHQSSRQNKRV
jgi:hypothetical protein